MPPNDEPVHETADPSGPDPATTPTVAYVPPEERPPAADRPFRPSLALMLATALVATALATAGVALADGAIRMDVDEPADQGSGGPSAADSLAYQAELLRRSAQQAALSMGVAGALIAGLFGAAFGRVRGTALDTLLGVGVGVGLGAALGCCAGYWGEFHHDRAAYAANDTPGLALTLTMQATFWAPLALAVAAAAIAVCRGRRAGPSLLAGVLAALLAAPLAGFAGTMLFLPHFRDDFPPATVPQAVLVFACGALALALFFWMVHRDPVPPRPDSAAAG